MNKPKRRKNPIFNLAFVAALLVWGTMGSYAEALRSTVLTDWSRRTLLIRIELDTREAKIALPSGRLDAERLIEQSLPGLVKDAVFSLRVDSYRKVGDSLVDGTLDVNEVLDLALEARRLDAAFSKDLRYFIASYEFPMLAASGLYLRHSKPILLKAPLAFQASKPYTGIVIYAKGSLPVHGEGKEGRLEPCLYPRIFDSDMNLVLDRNIVAPEALRRWGPVGYSRGLGIEADARVGETPIRIMAKALFGTARTDLVISRDDALKILALSENRALLTEGRIYIVADLEP